MRGNKKVIRYADGNMIGEDVQILSESEGKSSLIFSVKVHKGVHDVFMDIYSPEDALIDIKVFPRRFMRKGLELKKDKNTHEKFTIFSKDDEVIFELSSRNIEFSISLEESNDAAVIYLAGDSTVCDQEKEPFTGWGQMLSCFFNEGIAISNHAYSGRSTKSFIDEGRLDNILSTIKEGDYLFIQFGHNDQKDDERHTDPYTTYIETLKVYIDEAKKRKAVPVLVTSMHRRFFDENNKIKNTLGDYPDAMRKLAKDEGIYLIDLHKKSEILFNQYGVEKTKELFIWVDGGVYPDYPDGIQDNTHFTELGAYELAKLVVEGIRENNMEIVKYMK